MRAPSAKVGASDRAEEKPPTAGRSRADERRYDVAEGQRGGGEAPSPAAATQGQPGAGSAAVAHRRGRRQRVRTALELIRANPTGRIALKGFVAIAGAIVVAVGIALIPLPGPGWLLVIAGLGIWAIEFIWARHLLRFTRRHVHAWTRWAATQSLPVRVLLGAAGLIFVSVVVWLSLRFSLGIDLVAGLLRYLATH